MAFVRTEPVSEKEAGLMNILQLAYIGDAVWELIIRNMLVRKKYNVRHMHSECIRHVNAHAQAVYARRLQPELSPEEADFVRRGRNAQFHHPVPKNQNPEDYSLATGFEALIGYLHLTGNADRIETLAEIILGGEDNG